MGEGELEDPCELAAMDGVAAASALAGNWDVKFPGDPEGRHAELAATLAPHGWHFPGLAAGQHQRLPGASLARALGWFKLAERHRPAAT